MHNPPSYFKHINFVIHFIEKMENEKIAREVKILTIKMADLDKCNNKEKGEL